MSELTEDFSYFNDDDERVLDETTMALSLLAGPPDLAAEMSPFGRTLCYMGMASSAFLTIATITSLHNWIAWSNLLLTALQLLLVAGIWVFLLLYCLTKIAADNRTKLANEIALEEYQERADQYFEELHASKRDARIRKNKALDTELRLRETRLTADTAGNRPVIWLPETGQMIIPPTGVHIEQVPNSFHYHVNAPGGMKALESGKESPLIQDVIPGIVRYDDIRHQITEGLSLLGIHPENGNLELIEPRLYKIALFLGATDTGKTNTVYGKTEDMVTRFGANLLVADPHAHKKDSLTRKLAPLYYALYRDQHGRVVPPAVTAKQIAHVLQTFLDEFQARLGGADTSVPVLLVADEIPNMLRNEVLAPLIRTLVQTCGDEIRGFNMLFFGISQRAAGVKFLRDAAQTIIVHGMLQESEAMLAVNNDKPLAKLVQQHARHKGRTVAYGYEFDAMVLQQALHTIPHDEKATQMVESWLARNPSQVEDLPPRETTVVEELEEIEGNDGNDQETAEEAETSNIISLPGNNFSGPQKAIKKASDVGNEMRTAIRRGFSRGLNAGDVAYMVGLSGRKYGIFQDVCLEMGIDTGDTPRTAQEETR
jgi:hypothetical protein